MYNIVALGGGTGISACLRGLKTCAKSAVTAVISPFDNGGSALFFKKKKGPAPNDTRKALCALAHTDHTHPFHKAFCHRFETHTVGNFMLDSLFSCTAEEGAHVWKLIKQGLHVDGNVLLASTTSAELCAKREDGTVLFGENAIDIPQDASPDKHITQLWIEPEPKPNEAAIEALRTARMVIIGPGDLYSSILPPILVLRDALRSSPATKVYVANLMTKYGETHDFSLENFVAELEKYIGARCIDYVIANSELPPKELYDLYGNTRSDPVLPRGDDTLHAHLFALPLIDKQNPYPLRHDSEKLLNVISAIANNRIR